MLRKFAQGDLKKIILPGSDVQSTIPKLEPDLSSDYSRWGIDIHVDRSYANDGLEEYDNRNLINEKVICFRTLVLNILVFLTT